MFNVGMARCKTLTADDTSNVPAALATRSSSCFGFCAGSSESEAICFSRQLSAVPPSA